MVRFEMGVTIYDGLVGEINSFIDLELNVECMCAVVSSYTPVYGLGVDKCTLIHINIYSYIYSHTHMQ